MDEYRLRNMSKKRKAAFCKGRVLQRKRIVTDNDVEELRDMLIEAVEEFIMEEAGDLFSPDFLVQGWLDENHEECELEWREVKNLLENAFLSQLLKLAETGIFYWSSLNFELLDN